MGETFATRCSVVCVLCFCFFLRLWGLSLWGGGSWGVEGSWGGGGRCGEVERNCDKTRVFCPGWGGGGDAGKLGWVWFVCECGGGGGWWWVGVLLVRYVASLAFFCVKPKEIPPLFFRLFFCLFASFRHFFFFHLASISFVFFYIFFVVNAKKKQKKKSTWNCFPWGLVWVGLGGGGKGVWCGVDWVPRLRDSSGQTNGGVCGRKLSEITVFWDCVEGVSFNPNGGGCCCFLLCNRCHTRVYALTLSFCTHKGKVRGMPGERHLR